MYFGELGLVTLDDGNHISYIPWCHVEGLFDWMEEQFKPYHLYPGHVFTRKQAGYILAYYNEGES
jgi:hypothetical protein